MASIDRKLFSYDPKKIFFLNFHDNINRVFQNDRYKYVSLAFCSFSYIFSSHWDVFACTTKQVNKTSVICCALFCMCYMIYSWIFTEHKASIDDRAPVQGIFDTSNNWAMPLHFLSMYTANRSLRSDTKNLTVPRYHLEGFGRRYLTYVTKSIWNPHATPVKMPLPWMLSKAAWRLIYLMCHVPHIMLLSVRNNINANVYMLLIL